MSDPRILTIGHAAEFPIAEADGDEPMAYRHDNDHGFSSPDEIDPQPGDLEQARIAELEAEAVPQAALERIIANLTEDRDDARRLAKSWSESSALWLGSWERIIGELGELANVVRARPEGSRCATVEELDALLTTQADDPAPTLPDQERIAELEAQLAKAKARIAELLRGIP